VLAVIGRQTIDHGTIAGTIEIGGTLGDPIARVRVAATGLAMPPGPGGRPVKTVERLTIDASWDGERARAVIDGAQPGGRLYATATVRPDALDEATVRLHAKQFDLAPVLVFAPGPIGAATGRLDAELTLRGLDLATARLAGELHLRDGRVPIAAQVGTLRRANIDVAVRDTGLELSVDGRLGRGHVSGSGRIAMRGAQPTEGRIKLALRDVSPIGAVEPEIDADVDIALRRGDERWLAEVDVRNAVVVVPEQRGRELKPVGAPPDLVFATAEEDGDDLPDRPVVVATIRIAPTYVESEEARAVVRGELRVTLDGDDVAVVGAIEADRGSLDLFGRRYDVERASVRFDGSTDPVLDVRISRDIRDVTTYTEIRGRLSDPELILTSTPATYSQGQLLGFLLGGEPDGTPGDATDRATAAGASYLANRLGGYVRRALPIDLDVLRYEAATATSSAAVTVGTWITRNLFLAYRRRLDARPDENTGEGELEYWIRRRVVLEAVFGDRNVNGLDLLWRRRY
jgi:translocation and assembly module TamB